MSLPQFTFMRYLTYDKSSPTPTGRVGWWWHDTQMQQVGRQWPNEDRYSAKRTGRTAVTWEGGHTFGDYFGAQSKRLRLRKETGELGPRKGRLQLFPNRVVTRSLTKYSFLSLDMVSLVLGSTGERRQIAVSKVHYKGPGWTDRVNEMSSE